jgi:hypothetical protein
MLASAPAAHAAIVPELSYQAYADYVDFDLPGFDQDGSLVANTAAAGPVTETATVTFVDAGDSVNSTAFAVADFTSIGASGSIAITGSAVATTQTIAAAQALDFYTPTGGVGTVDMAFTFTITGTITGNLAGAVVTAGALVDLTPDGVADVDGGVLQVALLESPALGANSLTVTTPAVTVTYGEAVEISFALAVATAANDGDSAAAAVDADFSGTVVLSQIIVSGPGGASSTSGVVVPVISIPSPATWLALLIAGLLGLVPARQRSAVRRR